MSVLEWKTSKEEVQNRKRMKFWAGMACWCILRHVEDKYFLIGRTTAMKVALILCGEAHEDGPGLFCTRECHWSAEIIIFLAARVSTKDATSLVGHVFKVRITSFCPLGGNIFLSFALGCYGSHENEKHPGTKDGFPPQHVYRVVVGVSFFPFGEVHFCRCDSL